MQRIGKEKIEREKGYLYFVGKDGKVWRTPMKSNTTGTKKCVGTETIKKDPAKMYFLDKAGFVAESPMIRTGRPKGTKNGRKRKKAKK